MPTAPRPDPQPSRPRIRPSVALNAVLTCLALVAFLLLALRTEPERGIEVERRDAPAGIDEMRVEIRGAVAEPGVYPAVPGDRISDVIERAGGETSEADLSALNLALRVRDEDVIVVPAQGEVPTLVDLNTATTAELEALPGIGEARAAAIVAGRPYADAEEVATRGVIPASVWDQIRLLVTAR